MNSNEDPEITVQEIGEYADSIINSSRLVKTPRNSTADFNNSSSNLSGLNLNLLAPLSVDEQASLSSTGDNNNNNNKTRPQTTTGSNVVRILSAIPSRPPSVSSQSRRVIRSAAHSTAAPTPTPLITSPFVINLALNLPKHYRPNSSGSMACTSKSAVAAGGAAIELPLWKYNTIRKSMPLSVNKENLNGTNLRNRKFDPNSSEFFLSSSTYLSREQNSPRPKSSKSRPTSKIQIKDDDYEEEEVEENGEIVVIENDEEKELEHLSSAAVNNQSFLSSASSMRLDTTTKSSYNRARSVTTAGTTTMRESPSSRATSTRQTTARPISSGRSSLNVGEFNRFKNSLLKHHLRPVNDYDYQDANYNIGGGGSLLTTSYQQQQHQQQPPRRQPKIIVRSTPESSVELMNRGMQVSKIRSIYEALQRDNITSNKCRVYSVDTKRSNYLKNIQQAQRFLSSSLSIKKL